MANGQNGQDDEVDIIGFLSSIGDAISRWNAERNVEAGFSGGMMSSSQPQIGVVSSAITGPAGRAASGARGFLQGILRRSPDDVVNDLSRRTVQGSVDARAASNPFMDADDLLEMYRRIRARGGRAAGTPRRTGSGRVTRTGRFEEGLGKLDEILDIIGIGQPQQENVGRRLQFDAITSTPAVARLLHDLVADRDLRRHSEQRARQTVE